MIHKNLHMCFTKIKNPSSPTTTLNIDDDDDPSTSSSILIKNFNSLYDYNTTTSNTKSLSAEPDSDTEADSDITEPDFATIFASQRFFFTSPGSSNSIIESSSITTSSSSMATSSTPEIILESNNNSTTPSSIQSCTSSSSSSSPLQCVKDTSIAVSTYSPDPYTDFRRSMQEMVEARGDLVDVKANWDYLHELLLCYLALNPKSTHKFIISAFADLLVSLMSLSSSSPETDHHRREPELSTD